MKGLFDRMASSLILEVHENESSASKELERYIKNLCSLTDKISYQKGANSTEAAPFVAVLRAEGNLQAFFITAFPAVMNLLPSSWAFIMRQGLGSLYQSMIEQLSLPCQLMKLI